VRPFGLFVAMMMLALASLTGTASACTGTSTVAVSAPAAPALIPTQTQVHTQVQSHVANSAEVLPIVAVSYQRAEAAGYQHDGPHQHDHSGATGCCMLCCCATAPHILLQDSEIFLDRPFVRAFFVAAPAAVARIVAGLPFRPPRTA